MAFSPFQPQPVTPFQRSAMPPVEWLRQNQLAQVYPYRPGFGGVVQAMTEPGYHMLGHAGAIEGIVTVSYALQRQLRTQAGNRPAIVNVYSVYYQSQ